MTQKLDVITFGEAMAMFMANEVGPLHRVHQYTRDLAGAETNVAIGLARLGFGSGWVSKVGNDSFGRFIVEQLQEEKVNIDYVVTDDQYPTGFQVKERVLKGDPEVQYHRKGSAASQLQVADFNEDYFLRAGHLHMTGIPLALSEHTRRFAQHALTFMRKNNRKVTFDPNLRPSLWDSKEEMIRVTNEIAFQAHYVLPGLSEGEILTGYSEPSDVADFYLNRGVELVVIKLGEQGAYFKTKDVEGTVAGFAVEKVIDTVGAGDGFAVGLISGLLESLPIQESVRRANAIGSLAVQSAGDHEGYPTREQLEAYLKTNE